MGQGHPSLSGRSEGTRRPRFISKGSERDREECALAHRWIGRPGTVDEDAPHLRRRRRLQRRQLWRTQLSFWHPRTLDALDLERTIDFEAASVRLAVSHFQRLRAHVNSLECHYGIAG